MYQQLEDAIPYRDSKHLLWIPLGVLLLILIGVSVPIEIVLFLIPTGDPNQRLTLSRLIAQILIVMVALYLIRRISKVTPQNLGFTKNQVITGALAGSFAGFLAISAVAFLIWLLGGVSVSSNFQSSQLPALLLGLGFFLVQGPFEEILFRGYLMPHFSKAKGILFSFVVSSLMFALLHGLNPGITVVPAINLVLAGLVFASIFYNWGSLWIAGFAHAVWNFSQGLIYGSLVSGLTMQGSVLTSVPIPGKDFISGGNFGFEGSLVTSALGVILIVIFGMMAKKKHNAGELAAS
ncbi:CPBP family intramembrane glutamic endopeptidase [Boudabousia marimammalium]|uniref:CAAX prenyl protease 2/Lysostaphin resistance protein A-like domain-containing protein n=1 Tax=Boudabousia marimammalium TaxID=156892 RepID=A0A1Q5PS17_9ACTO|nr:type II CAAX endopeptidase family protein [Boudabousia marimammalium]OKL50299.1 hypothetical protein BM477_02620 [Boudabousia marimammalium]